MPSFERVHIPEAEFLANTESEKLQLLSLKLGDIGLNATDLLFCGIEGKSLLESEPEERFMTHAVTYDMFAEVARELDETDGTYSEYPLLYMGPIAPAVAVYGRSRMQHVDPINYDQNDWYEEWANIDGSSVNDALEAVVFIDK